MLNLRDKSVSSLKSLADCSLGSIDILASSVPSQYILPSVLGDFHKLHPAIVFNVQQADTADVVKGIAAHESEVGFIGAKIENSKCVYKEFMSERLVIITPYEKRFDDISPEGIDNLLTSEYFVMREPGSGTRLEYEEDLKHIGIKLSKLKVSACFDNTQSIIHAVASGLGISIVSELAAKHYNHCKMIKIIYVQDFPERNFYTVMKKNSPVSETVNSFIEFIHSSPPFADMQKGVRDNCQM
jgi:DNA-binding transcriptional LysR family regulator